MKKLFMFLAVAGLATFGASCSSDDNKNDDPKQKDLVLSGKTEVKVDEAVTFTVKVGDKAEAGTDLYVGGEKVSNPYTFTKVGEFKVQAKKKGFNDSNVLTVKVSDEDVIGPDPKKLVLSVVGSSEVNIGDNVVFAVKDAEGQNVTGVTIKTGTTTVDNPWTPTEAGTFKFVASKEGFENSNEVSVTVKETTVPEGQFLKVGDVNYSIDDTKTKLYAHTITQNGQNFIRLYSQTIEGQEIFYCVFVMDVRTADFAASQDGTTGAVARFTKLVVQDPESEDVLLPGVNPEAEVNMASWILSESGEVDFTAAEVTLFDVDLIGFQDGGTTQITAGNANGSASYDGAFDSMYAIDTTNETAIAKNAKAVKSGNKLVKLKKLAK